MFANFAAPNRLGILLLDSQGDYLIGDPAHPATFRDAVRVKAKGVTFQDLLEPHEWVLNSLKDAITELEDEGADIIIGTCGLLSLHQKALQAASNAGLILSSLKALSTLRHMFKPEKMEIVTAHSEILSPIHVIPYGISNPALHRIGLQEGEHFQRWVIQKSETANPDLLISETVGVIQAYLSNHPEIKILVSECTNTLPLREKWKEQISVPIVDLYSLLSMVYYM